MDDTDLPAGRQVEQISTDKIRLNPNHPCHPCSIKNAE